MPAQTMDPLSRKEFLRTSAAAVGVGLMGGCAPVAGRRAPGEITFGAFTDSHYCDREAWSGRCYRDSAAKLTAFVERMNEARPAFVIMLGDFIDQRDSPEAERADLRRIEAVYAQFKGPRHYVFGNHELGTLSKKQFLADTGMRAAHYAFDAAPLHCVVLDANYRKDFTPYEAGNFEWTDSWVPPEQQAWLAADLAKTTGPAVAFCHQRLDDEKSPYGVKNGQDVRRILESSGRVVAVFQGHHHDGGYREINGIHYVTLRAMVEGPGLTNNAFALVTVSRDGRIAIRGFGKQASSSLP